MHSCRILFFLILSIIHVQAAMATGLVVEVSGLNDEKKKNVLSFLKINTITTDREVSVGELRRLHKQAPKQIKEALAPFGYYQVEVVSNLEKVGEQWSASYHVDLGDPILVVDSNSDQMLVGEGKDNEYLVNLKGNFPLIPGTVLDQRIYEESKKNFIRVALAQGYLDAKFSKSIIRVNRQKNEAEIILEFDTGSLYYFGEVSSDQKVLQPSVLEKYFDIEEGEPYANNRLSELQRALYKSGYFKYVDVKGDVSNSQGVTVPIIVNVVPQEHMNRYEFGLGFATDTGLHGKIGWENKLLNSRGHKVKSNIKIGQRESDFAVFYEIPILNPRYDSHILGATYSTETWDDTTTQLFALGATLSHDGPKFNYGTSLEFRDEIYSVGVTDGEVFLVMPSVNWSVVFADNIANTKNGIKLWANARGSVQGLISEVTFIQGDAGVKGILSPLPLWRIIGRINIGATGVDDIDELPPSLRFYTGGDQTVRGYGYKQIGPEDSSGTLVGGKYLLVESIEVEREINDLWALAAFVDSGNAMNDLDADMNQGAGLGVRIRLPFGQIRLDVACAVSDPDYPFRLHLTVGGDL